MVQEESSERGRQVFGDWQKSWRCPPWQELVGGIIHWTPSGRRKRMQFVFAETKMNPNPFCAQQGLLAAGGGVQPACNFLLASTSQPLPLNIVEASPAKKFG